MQGQHGFGEDVSAHMQDEQAERIYQQRRQEENHEVRPTKVNEKSGRTVYDTEKNARWRQDYYKRVADNANETEQQIRRAIAAKNMGQLNILNTKQTSEMLKCSQATAWIQMKTGIIPAFRVGGRWFTHDYVIDLILAKGRQLVQDGYADKTLERMVWKSDNGMKW